MAKVIPKIVYRPFCHANIDLSISTRLSKIAAATCTLDRIIVSIRSSNSRFDRPSAREIFYQRLTI